MDRALPIAGVVLAGMIGVAGGYWWTTNTTPSVTSSPPDVVVVLWDTVRADRLSVYGHSRPTSPRLDALAANGTVYEQAQSPGMWTVPSHASMFTGLPVITHGSRVGWLWLDDHHLTVAEHFKANGYTTFAWSANPYLSPATNLLQGFDSVHLTWTGEQAVPCAAATKAKLLANDASVVMSPAWVGEGEGWSEHLTVTKDCAPRGMSTLLEHLDASAEPVFAYVNLLEAHHPRLPSLASREAVMSPDLQAAGLATDGSLRRLMGAMEGKESFTEAEHEALLGVYDASLRDLDDALGVLIDGLNDRGTLESTVIVVVGDHGEHFGEDGMFDHRWSVHQALLHVPLVVVGPGVEAKRVAAPVSTAGLFGSLIALAGLTEPVGAPHLSDLGPVFSALVAPTPRLPDVERAWPDLDPKRWKRRFGVVVDGSHKFIRDDKGGEQLFDLTTDPLQEVPLTDPELAVALGQVLKAWRRGVPRYDPSLRTPNDRPGRPMEQDADTKAQLRLLGYVEEGAP